MKAPFAYYGGKTGMARRLVAMLPPHRTYIEPFFGSGAVLFAKAPARHEIINDVDRNVVTFFRVLRERTDELVDVCALTPHAREEYQAAALTEDLDDLERARRFWVRVNQSFSHAAGPRSGWSVTTSRTQSVPGSILGRISRFAAAADRLMHCTIECCEAGDLIARLATADTAIYVDPPYLASTRRSGNGSRASDYITDMGDEDSHRRLAEVLRSTSAAVLLSGYLSPLYDELYGDWDRIEIPVLAQASNDVTADRGERTEVIWSNRPLDRPLSLFEEAR